MDRSPLGRLPVEIRLVIYEYATARTKIDLDNFREGGALLQVCSQIRREARLVLFSHASITVGNHFRRLLREPIGSDKCTLPHKSREFSMVLANVFGPDALKAIPAGAFRFSDVRVKDSGYYAIFISAKFRLDCIQCNPWLSRGGMIDSEEDAGKPRKGRGGKTSKGRIHKTYCNDLLSLVRRDKAAPRPFAES